MEVLARAIPDINVYQHKKTLAQGLMDIALLSANASQLRYVLEDSNHPYYFAGLALIATSLILQVVVAGGLLMNAKYNVKDSKHLKFANRVNNLTIIGIFLVTIVNIFITAFTTTSVKPEKPCVPCEKVESVTLKNQSLNSTFLP